MVYTTLLVTISTIPTIQVRYRLNPTILLWYGLYMTAVVGYRYIVGGLYRVLYMGLYMGGSI